MDNQNQNLQYKKSTNGLAIAGFILAFFAPLIGLILSIVSLSQIKKNNQSGKGLAIAGIVLSSIAMIILPILIIATLSIGGVQQNSRDNEREVDIRAIHNQLEIYYAQNEYYPSFVQVNDPQFRQSNFSDLSDDALIDPQASIAQLTSTPSFSRYSYEVLPANCDNKTVSTQCKSYTLTASYEGTVDGQQTYVKQSLYP